MLQQIIAWLHDFERRLQYAAPPVREWLCTAAKAYPDLEFISQTVSLLQTEDLENAWKRALNTTEDLEKEDIDTLCRLGAHLGKSDADTQLQCVGETLATLEERRKTVTLTAQKADKLYLTLGTSGGLALALLLI